MSQVLRLRLALLVVSAVTVVLLGLVGIVSRGTAMGVLSNVDAVGDFGVAPTWSLVDQSERTVRSSMFEGKIILADFIYTHCTDICPQLSLSMGAVQERLLAEGLLGHEVQLLSFTTDPARDTPDLLRAYAARHNADPDAWRFLTGPEATLVPLIVEGFRLGVQALPPATAGSNDSHTNTASYEVMHSGRFVLIDRQGHIRAYFDGQAFEPDRVIRVIRDLMREQ
jgi:protein SCO1